MLVVSKEQNKHLKSFSTFNQAFIFVPVSSATEYVEICIRHLNFWLSDFPLVKQSASKFIKEIMTKSTKHLENA